MEKIIFISIFISIFFAITFSHMGGDPQLMQRFCASNVTDAMLTKLEACDQYIHPGFLNATKNCLKTLNLGTTFKDRRTAKCDSKTKGQLFDCIRSGRQQQFGGSTNGTSAGAGRPRKVNRERGGRGRSGGSGGSGGSGWQRGKLDECMKAALN